MTASPRNAGRRPPLAIRFLARMNRDGERFALLGDLEEEWSVLEREKGRRPAGIWCWGEIGRSLPRYAKNQISWRILMFKNYLKIALRNLQRQRGYSLINILGLAAGIAGCWLIFLFVSREMSYDRHWPASERIYRVAEEIKSSTATRQFAHISFPYAPAVKSEYPEVESVARLCMMGTMLVEKGEKKIYENDILGADPGIFSVLGFPLAEGDPATALANPNTAVLSETMARKYFGTESAMGKTLLMGGRFSIQITGIFKKLPSSTQIKFDGLVSLSTLRAVFDQEFSNWHNTMAITYLKLKPGVDVPDFERRMSGLAARHVGEALKAKGQAYRYFLQPITSIHLHSNLLGELEPSGNATVLSLLSAAAVFILLIAGLNFISLSTASSARRAREVGLRKVVGATRKQLMLQLLGESAFLAGLAALVAASLTVVVLRAFNHLAGTDFTLAALLGPRFLLFGLVIVFLTGFGAGTYPALVLSSFRPAATLKGSFKSGRSGGRMRRVIVVGQFFATALLIAGTLMVVRQIRYMKGQDLGFVKEQMLILPVRGRGALDARAETIKAAFLKYPSIRGAAASASVPGRSLSNFSVRLEDQGANSNWAMNHFFIDADLIPLYRMTMAAGRAFDKNMATDRTTDFEKAPVFIINEAAVRAFGFGSASEAIDKRIRTGFGGRVGKIIGVIRDFHYSGLQQTIAPLVMEWFPRQFGYLTLSVQASGLRETMMQVEKEWNVQFPGLPLESFFLDEDFNRQYQADDRLLAIVRIFTLLGIFVSCLGLFGLSAFLAEQRTKEIGIRKVLGATAAGIALRFSNNFIGLVLLANVLAVPAAWLIMNRWLQSYAYRAPISAWTFVAAAAVSLVVTLLTVAYQSVRAAWANPADSLRSE
jgi:putative ABC transport system permease protein